MSLLQVKRIHPDGRLPTKAHSSDLGYDLYNREYITVPSYSVVRIKTGICIKLPNRYGAIIRDRSSMALRGLFVVGGVIDNGYTGEVIILFYNSNMHMEVIKEGDKIAQLIPIETTSWEIMEVEELEKTDRGSKGFGSSGT